LRRALAQAKSAPSPCKSSRIRFFANLICSQVAVCQAHRGLTPDGSQVPGPFITARGTTLHGGCGRGLPGRRAHCVLLPLWSMSGFRPKSRSIDSARPLLPGHCRGTGDGSQVPITSVMQGRLSVCARNQSCRLSRSRHRDTIREIQKR